MADIKIVDVKSVYGTSLVEIPGDYTYKTFGKPKDGHFWLDTDGSIKSDAFSQNRIIVEKGKPKQVLSRFTLKKVG